MSDERYDLFSPAFKRDPFVTFGRMREHDPVYRHVAPDGRVIWYVTRYEDVVAVLKDGERFCKSRATAVPEAYDVSAGSSVHQAINQNMLFADPPDHTRLRALVSQAFTPSRVARLAPQVREAAVCLLDEMAQGERPYDLIEQYALPLPVMVIGDLLGVPRVDQDELAELSQIIISPSRLRLGKRERRRRMGAFVAYLRGLFASRRAVPQDDLMTALVEAEADGERLSEEELSSMVALLLVTGHETTVNLIGNGVLALLRNPVQLGLLLAGEVGWDAAVEELLRYDGPVESSTTRWVRRDCVFRGQRMRRGEVMRVVLTSANRDAAVFAAPDELDVRRRDAGRHVAFGQGIHYCLGAPLARLEGRVALPLLFERFPGLSLAISPEELAWRAGVLFRGLAALPVWG